MSGISCVDQARDAANFVTHSSLAGSTNSLKIFFANKKLKQEETKYKLSKIHKTLKYIVGDGFGLFFCAGDQYTSQWEVSILVF